MTLVLTMKPFLEAEGDPPLSSYPPKWEVGDSTKTTLTSSAPPPPLSSEQPPFVQEASCRRIPAHISVSRISFFKRKFVHDDEPSFNFRTYYQTAAPALEERTHVLRVSMEKMRFIDDPEAFLRRSVLVNNLLRRLRAEILLQSSDWSFPPNPALASVPCILPPTMTPPHVALQRALPTHHCLVPLAGPPLRKRIRTVRGGQGDTAGCLHLPFSFYNSALSTCPSSSHTFLLQLASHSQLAVTNHGVGEDGEHVREETAEEEDEHRRSSSSKEVKVQKSRTEALQDQHGRTRKEVGHLTRDEEEDKEEYEEEDEEAEEEDDAGKRERELQKVRLWYRRTSGQYQLMLPDNCG